MVKADESYQITVNSVIYHVCIISSCVTSLQDGFDLCVLLLYPGRSAHFYMDPKVLTDCPLLLRTAVGCRQFKSHD